jgi:hypothetical protein
VEAGGNYMIHYYSTGQDQLKHRRRLTEYQTMTDCELQLQQSIGTRL